MAATLEFDRLKQSLLGFIKSALHRIDYLALYPAKVTLQNADKTLQVQPDDSRLPTMDKLAIKYGIPGVTATVQAGTRVFVGFANGRPDQPFCALWDTTGTTLTLNLTANNIVINGGSNGVARNGDAIQITAAQILAAGMTAGATPVTIPTGPLQGTINAGSSSVKCG